MFRRLVFITCLVAAIGPAVHAQIDWDRVVYWDSRYPTAWGGDGAAMRDALQAAGYQVLNADELKTWMDARIADGALSVVVMCRDSAPDTVVESQSSSCTLRKYLDAGGKVVWYADIPFYYNGHVDGTSDTWGDAGAPAVLGFNTSSAPRDSGNTVTITSKGSTWGLTQTWGSQRPAAAGITTNMTILATDNAGNAAAWVKHYVTGDRYRGFVRIYDTPGTPDPADVQRVAEYVPVKAEIVSPADGAIVQTTATPIQWNAGLFAGQHHVYFGTSQADVAAGTGDTDKGLQPGTSKFIPSLAPGNTYYWRIDEVNDLHPDSPWTGDVWSFTVPEMNAYDPVPADGADPVIDNTLSWSPGLQMLYQWIYIDTDKAAVENATQADAVSEGATTSFTTTLEPGTTYYWRVDTLSQMDLTKTNEGQIWSFKTIETIPISDPNLKAWYALDEGEGTSLIDSSGYGNHAATTGDPQWVLNAVDGGGLHFDGSDDAVEIGPIGFGPTAPRTITAWAKADNTGIPGWTTIFGFCNASGGGNLFFDLERLGNQGNGYGIHRYGWEKPITPSLDTEWHHLAGTLSGDTVEWFHNGESMGSEGGLTINITDYLMMGMRRDNQHKFAGTIDDCRVYDYALTSAELKVVMRGDVKRAWNEIPVNQSVVSVESVNQLTWTPGEGATQHQVYFGTDRDAVDDATPADPMGVFKGTQSAAAYVPVVEQGQQYYWRIDEIHAGGTTKGRVWTFTVAPYLIVDDFESYTDDSPDRIFQTWIDGFGFTTPDPGNPGNGTGSTVGYLDAPFAEQTIVHGGDQSMPMAYDNTTSPFISEAIRTFATPQNFRRSGSAALSLWYQGRLAPGSLSVNGSQITINGAGADIWGTSDQFHYASVQRNSFTSVSVKVESVENTNGWAKAGVMIRNSLDADSTHVFSCATPAQGVSFQRREAVAQASSSDTTVGIQTPVWVKLELSAGDIIASYSEDGVNYTTIGELTGFTLAPTFNIGLAVTSHNPGAICTAKLSDFRIDGTPVTLSQSQDIGITATNAQAPMYVELIDTVGSSARVVHPDPTAVNTTSWQQWNIDLNDFTGINLMQVKKIAFGVGNKGTSAATGTGLMYVDDIALYPPRFVAGKLAPRAEDLVFDGVIDLLDVEVWVQDWLAEDDSVVASDPGAANLIAHYAFEGNTNDSVGNNDGHPVGDPTYAAGVVGQAINLDGTQCVVTDVNATDLGIGGAAAKSIAGWAMVRSYNGGGLWELGTNANGQDFSLRTMGTLYLWRTQLYGGAYDHDFRCKGLNEWVHYAQVYDGTTSSIYANGALVSEEPRTLNTTNTKNLAIGRWSGNEFDGLMDDVRVYNRGLSQAEVAYLASGSGTVYLPLMSPSELYAGEAEGNRIVDFKDLAMILDKWLERQVWPE